ncbi:hypothetical protein R8871_04039 [Paraburkholderia graminis C4D1M]|uniref:Uncharacterized protein n=1 Tax=Paraburkholderia graminis (strain ATCC 700544 / DSM 17151 / LMG 18924 / NCIMB 13744 / C4D1M) TaxID=396598 RepID=B1G6W6_PARG4|nr:hypothetical protein BgramDRAFT_5085 [Paraburkholderia graminis C4D1M]CAB3709258.1 hypothetical protein R8871_04039 [Paraburkholderia graminis C4D1M]
MVDRVRGLREYKRPPVCNLTDHRSLVQRFYSNGRTDRNDGGREGRRRQNSRRQSETVDLMMFHVIFVDCPRDVGGPALAAHDRAQEGPRSMKTPEKAPMRALQTVVAARSAQCATPARLLARRAAQRKLAETWCVFRQRSEYWRRVPARGPPLPDPVGSDRRFVCRPPRLSRCPTIKSHPPRADMQT